MHSHFHPGQVSTAVHFNVVKTTKRPYKMFLRVFPWQRTAHPKFTTIWPGSALHITTFPSRLECSPGEEDDGTPSPTCLKTVPVLCFPKTHPF